MKLKWWKRGHYKMAITDEQFTALQNQVNETTETNKKLNESLAELTKKNTELENKFVEQTSSIGKFQRENIGVDVVNKWKEGKK